MHVVIVSDEIIGPTKNGGIGTFTTHWALLLAKHTAHHVTILYTGQIHDAPDDWHALYETHHIEIIPVDITFPEDAISRYGNEWFIQRGHAISAALPATTDIIYFQENTADSFVYLRQRQFQPGTHPTVVTVMHSNSNWIREAMQQVTWNFGALNGNFAERYGVQHSDFVLSLSQYLIDHVQDRGWTLPDAARVQAPGGPFLPLQAADRPSKVPHGVFRRLIFFGRLETRKGFELFIDTLIQLHRDDPALFDRIDRVVFLGREASHHSKSAAHAVQPLEACGLSPLLLTEYDTFAAQAYLAAHQADSLVVIPSLMDNHPYAVLEATLIENLNVICSNAGGIPEIIGNHPHQLFEPTGQGLQAALRHWLTRGPYTGAELATYDYAAANRRWLAVHEEITAFHQQKQPNAPRYNTEDSPTIDVCIVNHHTTHSLHRLLTSLAAQSDGVFGVRVLDDYVTTRTDAAAFSRLQSEFASEHWQFESHASLMGQNRARNYLASQSQAEYILFLDACSYAPPQMINRLRQSLRMTSHDALTTYVHAFSGATPYADLASRILTPPRYLYFPLGSTLDIAMLWNCFGSATDFIVSRRAFDAVNGFPDEAYPDYQTFAFSDYALFVKLAFAGYSIDVVPEFLVYRGVPDDYTHPLHVDAPSARAVRDCYRQQLQETGLEMLADVASGLGTEVNSIPVDSLRRVSGEVDPHHLHDPDWLAFHMTGDQIIRGLLKKVYYRLAAYVPSVCR